MEKEHHTEKETAISVKELPPSKPSKQTLDRSDFIALFALLISLGAFAVSIYEARILRTQQSLMQEQQKAAVWPFLEKVINYSYEAEGNEIVFAIKNKGVGPARMKNVELKIEGQTINSYHTFLETIKDLLPPDTYFNISFAELDGVLSADETHQFFKIEGPRFENDRQILQDLGFQFNICYCSIYEDCWTLMERDKQPQKGCL